MVDRGFTRREVLHAGAADIAAALAVSRSAESQAPRRGGIFRVSLSDPPHFDPHLTVSWPTLIADYSGRLMAAWLDRA